MSSYEALILSASEQRSEGWNTLRLRRFTSSKFELLLKAPKDKKEAAQNEGFGATAVSYIMEKAMEVYSGVCRDADIGDMYYIRKGRVLEAQGIRFYSLRENDYTVETTGFYVFGENAGGSPDFKSRKVGIGELKCPSKTVHDKYVMKINSFDDLKKVEPQYYWQLQVNMFVTGVPFGVFLSFDPTHFPEDVYREIDYESFAAEAAIEYGTESQKKLALHVVTGEMSPEVPEVFESTIERAVRLRDRFVNQLIEKKGCPDHLKDWKGSK